MYKFLYFNIIQISLNNENWNVQNIFTILEYFTYSHVHTELDDELCYTTWNYNKLKCNPYGIPKFDILLFYVASERIQEVILKLIKPYTGCWHQASSLLLLYLSDIYDPFLLFHIAYSIYFTHIYTVFVGLKKETLKLSKNVFTKINYIHFGPFHKANKYILKIP